MRTRNRHLLCGLALFISLSGSIWGQSINEADALFAEAKYAEAMAGYESIIQSSSDVDEVAAAKRKVASCHWKLGEHAAAIDDLEKFLAESPASPVSPDVKLDLANYRLMEKDFATALQEMDDFLKGAFTPVQERRATFMTAEAHWGLKNYAAAMPIYESFVDGSPDSPLTERARFRLIEHQSNQGKAARLQATNDFEQFAGERAGTEWEVRGRIRVALSLQDQGKMEEAEQIYRDLLATELTPVQENIVRRNLGRLLNVNKRHDEAIAVLEGAAPVPADSVSEENFAYWKARSLFLKEDDEPSLSQFTQFMQDWPDSKWIPQAKMMAAVAARRISLRIQNQGDQATAAEQDRGNTLKTQSEALRNEALAAGAAAGDLYIPIQVHFYWGEMASLKTDAEALIASRPSHDRHWAQGKLWLAMAVGLGEARDYTAAIQHCQDVLAEPLTDAEAIIPAWETHVPTEAANWGAFFAQQKGDDEMVRQFALILRDEMPARPERAHYLLNYGRYSAENE